MKRTIKPSELAKDAVRALQEAVALAIEEHRRKGVPYVVQRDGKMVIVDPRETPATVKRVASPRLAGPKSRKRQ